MGRCYLNIFSSLSDSTQLTTLDATLFNQVEILIQMATPTSYESSDEQPVSSKCCFDTNQFYHHFLDKELALASSSYHLPPGPTPSRSRGTVKLLDPDLITKWTEEGLAAVAMTSSDEVPLATQALKKALQVLQAIEVDLKQKSAVIGEYHRQKYR